MTEQYDDCDPQHWVPEGYAEKRIIPTIRPGAFIKSKRLHPDDIGLHVIYRWGDATRVGYLSSFTEGGAVFVRFGRGETGQRCPPERLSWADEPIFQVRYEKGNSHTLPKGLAITLHDALRVAQQSALSITGSRPEYLVRPTVVRRMGACALCGIIAIDLGWVKLHSGDFAELCRDCNGLKARFKEVGVEKHD